MGKKKSAKKSAKKYQVLQQGIIAQPLPAPRCYLYARWQLNQYNFLQFMHINNIDCVINALQLVGVFTAEEAARERNILIANGVRGLPFSSLSGLLNNRLPMYNFHFYLTDNMVPLNEAIDELRPGECLISGWLSGGSGHIFTIYRHEDGTVYLIDPQLNEYCQYQPLVSRIVTHIRGFTYNHPFVQTILGGKDYYAVMMLRE